MAHFTGRKVEPAQDFTRKDDAAADAGAQGHNHGVLIAFGAAGQVFAEGRGVRIVFHIHAAPQQAGQIRAQVPVIIAEIRVVAHKTGCEIHAARRADADILNLGKSKAGLFDHGAAEFRQSLFQVLGRAGQTG